MYTAHGHGLSFLSVDAGRWWPTWVCWERVPSERKGQWDSRQFQCCLLCDKGLTLSLKSQDLQDIYDLKKVRFSLDSASISVSGKCAASSRFVGIASVVRCQINIFIRAVCAKESSVMFIEGVPHCLVWLFVLWGDWGNETVCRSTTDRYLQPAGGKSFFYCQSVASHDGTHHRNCIVLLSEALSLQDDSWKKEGKLSASLRNNDEDSPYGFFLS